jgi:hypothetical protein
VTAEGMAAVVGLSAGVGSVVGGWVALWWHARVPFGERGLIRHIYVHVDEVLGATKTENIRRADRRHHVWRRLWFLPKDVRLGIINFFWPVPQYGTGTAALPGVKRMGHYVQIEWQVPPTRNRIWLLGRFGPLLYQRWNIQAVWLRWTAEAAANRDTFVEYLERGRPTQGGGLAQALGLEWKAGMFEHTWDREASLVRFARRGPAREIRTDVPHEVGVDA